MTNAQGLYSQGRDPETGLTRRQADVLRMINDENLSQLDVASRLGVSRQRVRQIVEDLIKKGHEVRGARAPAVTSS